MADIGILFSPPMVRALLEGRKTQTRRVLKLALPADADRVHAWFAPPEVPATGIPNQWAESGLWAQRNGPRGYNRYVGALPYRPGDRLWVRERLERANGEAVGYPADGSWLPNTPWLWQRNSLPSIHCPRRLSRLTLTVTDVRVERLQDISEADAVAEGCFKGKATGRVFNNVTEMRFGGSQWRNARDWYADLWDQINGPGAWDANPWVVAISFSIERRNIDAKDQSNG